MTASVGSGKYNYVHYIEMAGAGVAAVYEQFRGVSGVNI